VCPCSGGSLKVRWLESSRISHWFLSFPIAEEHLKQKVPELEKSLSLVQSMVEKQAAGITNGTVRYNFVDSVYAKANIDYTVGTVYLWLGANVMLEYTYDEAIQFLQNNLARAQTELSNVQSDLAMIRDQIVTSEVNISRIYNWDVRRKRVEHSNTSSNK
jgi:prefoldin subunit 5